MGLDKPIFVRIRPQDTNEAGDTINLWVSSSQTGSGGHYQNWKVKGMTVPTFGSRGNLSGILESTTSVGFKFLPQSDLSTGLTRIDMVEAANSKANSADACAAAGGVEIPEPAYWDSPYPQYSNYVYDSNDLNSPYPGNGRWWFIPQEPDYVFKIENDGRVSAYCTCSSAGDGYPEMQEPRMRSDYYFANIEQKIEFPNHYFLQFDKDILLPKGPVGALNSSSILNNVVFYPGFTENFEISDYNVTVNNNDDNRSSKIFLKVDRQRSDSQPTNIDYISDNLVPGTRVNLPEEVFANIQDSNYETSGWNIPRYEGAKNIARSGEIPTAITTTDFSGSIFPLAATSESIANEDSFESRKIQTLYLYSEYDPNSSFSGGGSGGNTLYIDVEDTLLDTGLNPVCPGLSTIRATSATLRNQSGTGVVNNSLGDLTINVKYILENIYGPGTLVLPITISSGSITGTTEYTSSYQTIPFGSSECRDVNQIYTGPTISSTLGDDNLVYRVVDSSIVIPSDISSVDTGTNYILKNRGKGTYVDVVQSAKVLDIRKRKIYTTNSNGIITGTADI